MTPPRHDDTATVRSVFVIGPDKTVKLTLTYPASTGRDFGEILRVLDSPHLTRAHGAGPPPDWRSGADGTITPAVSDEEAARRFPGYHAVKPYLRTTPDPRSSPREFPATSTEG